MTMKLRTIVLILYVCMLGIDVYAEPSVNEESQPTVSDIGEVLGRLEEKMSRMQTLKTSFIQEKDLAIFNQKVVLKGTIFLQKPSLFAWHVKEPVRYSLVIKGDVLRQWDEDTNRVQQVSLEKNPAFQAVIGQMRKWFSGTYTSMLKEYNVTILKQYPASLKFTSLESTVVSKVINSVIIIFREDERYIHQIRLEEKSGDSMLLTFVETQLNVPIDAAAWEVRPRVR